MIASVTDCDRYFLGLLLLWVLLSGCDRPNHQVNRTDGLRNGKHIDRDSVHGSSWIRYYVHDTLDGLELFYSDSTNQLQRIAVYSMGKELERIEFYSNGSVSRRVSASTSGAKEAWGYLPAEINIHATYDQRGVLDSLNEYPADVKLNDGDNQGGVIDSQ